MLDSSAMAQRAKSFSKNRVTGSQFIKSCERRKLCQSAPSGASLVFHVSIHIRKNAGRCRIVTSLGGNYNTGLTLSVHVATATDADNQADSGERRQHR